MIKNTKRPKDHCSDIIDKVFDLYIEPPPPPAFKSFKGMIFKKGVSKLGHKTIFSINVEKNNRR